MLAGWNLKNTTKISNKVRYACLEGKQYAKRKTRAKIHKGWLELQKCTHTQYAWEPNKYAKHLQKTTLCLTGT